MSPRPTRPPGKPRPRRATQFRATVERLDRRELMAAGVTGTTIPINGDVRTPLLVEDIEYYMPGLGGVPLEPVGTPVPLVSLQGDPTSTLTPSSYSGTVDWGDGTATDAAVFGTFNSQFGYAPGPQLTVNGPEHTYASPGTYTITVSVTGPGDTTPTVYTDTATIGNIPTITGQLNPASDTGLFSYDYITADNTPNFVGTTQPEAMVMISATSDTTGQTLVVGSSFADASGQWSITTIPFVDGSYHLTAEAVATSGATATTLLTSSLFNDPPLVIDIAGPKVTGFQITNAKTGTFMVSFLDAGGVLLPPTATPASYAISRSSPPLRKGQTLAASNLALATTSNYPGNLSSTYPVVVTGTLSGGKPLSSGTYTFTVHAAGIFALSGAQLDGEFTGKFPTGNGQAGGDFQVKFTVKNGKASQPTVVKPVKVTHPVKAKAVASHHA